MRETDFTSGANAFPDGKPEQLTSGPTEEQGLAVAPDGKSLITSVGLAQRSVWFHDATGERQISLEGYAYYPLLSADGTEGLFSCHARRRNRSESKRAVDGRLGFRTEAAVVSRPAGHQAMTFRATIASSRRCGERMDERDVWLAWLDGREPPQRIPHADGDNPRFGRDGEILFRVREGDSAALYRILENGERSRKDYASHRERCSVRCRRTASG